jgi:hypothetical protein
MKIWTVPQNMGKPHGLKYSLVYIQREERLIGYDNAKARETINTSWGKKYLTGL